MSRCSTTHTEQCPAVNGTQIAELELTVESMGKRLMRSEAGDTARIRKEMQDSEAGVHRRVEEVNMRVWGERRTGARGNGDDDKSRHDGNKHSIGSNIHDDELRPDKVTALTSRFTGVGDVSLMSRCAPHA